MLKLDTLTQLLLSYTAAVISDSTGVNASRRINNIIKVSSAFAQTLRTELDISTDPELLSLIGTKLVQVHDDQDGLTLLERAIDLDPENPAWKEALESAKAEPIRSRNRHTLLKGFK